MWSVLCSTQTPDVAVIIFFVDELLSGYIVVVGHASHAIRRVGELIGEFDETAAQGVAKLRGACMIMCF